MVVVKLINICYDYIDRLKTNSIFKILIYYLRWVFGDFRSLAVLQYCVISIEILEIIKIFVSASTRAEAMMELNSQEIMYNTQFIVHILDQTKHLL